MAKQTPEFRVTDCKAVEEGTERPVGKPFRVEAIDENGNVIGWGWIPNRNAAPGWYARFLAGDFANVDPSHETRPPGPPDPDADERPGAAKPPMAKPPVPPEVP